MAPKKPDSSLFIALLAGGRGTRFWPLSRHDHPKQFLDVTGEGPLLAVTRDRVAALAPAENMLVVTSADLAPTAARILSSPRANVLAEPVGRNTAAAVALALLVASERDSEAVVLALPTDHHVARPASLRKLLRRGVQAARKLRGTVLFGAVPDRPETGYGYLSPGPAVSVAGSAGLRRLRRFREKPDLAGAKKLIRTGAWWNTGMFCLHASTVLEHVNELLPELGRGLASLRPHVGKRSWKRALEEVYPNLPAISFDHGVLEQLPLVHALPADVGWSDVGAWEALAHLLPKTGKDNRTRGQVICHGGERNIVLGEEAGRTLVLLDVDDLVLVDAGDVVLACRRDAARDVPGLLRRLKKERPELL